MQRRHDVQFHAAWPQVWDSKIHVPVTRHLHDFAHRYLHRLLRGPMALDQAQMTVAAFTGLGLHEADRTFCIRAPRRDGKDVRWIERPTRSATHLMGRVSDNAQMLMRRLEMSMSNPFLVPWRRRA